MDAFMLLFYEYEIKNGLKIIISTSMLVTVCEKCCCFYLLNYNIIIYLNTKLPQLLKHPIHLNLLYES